VVNTVTEALRANGAEELDTDADILLVAYPLLPDTAAARFPLAAEAAAMAQRGDGRIVVLLSALAGVPMRRHVDCSAAMAAAFAEVRVLAMQFGPKVLVNAVGCGLIEDGGRRLSGDPHMLTHVPLGHAGSAGDISDAVLFLCDPMNSYTTGQMLMVDGGWSPGYGRNF
jgi:NAD(P)-dependent dehydrogenase (short-subunit alcohol dehydrogenase family)